MRMRKKKNLALRLELVSHLLIRTPESLKGKWAELIPGYEDIHIEIGCGKGKFTSETAKANPGILYIAIERVADAMIIAMERIKTLGLKNVYFINTDAAMLENIFESGEAGRIYINFCDPWPSVRHAKRRLTAPGFLESYKSILKQGGEIHFKTDNPGLFRYSREQMEYNGFELTELSENLHSDGICGVMTDYEAKFHAEGKQIYRIVARLHDNNINNTLVSCGYSGHKELGA